MRKILILAGVVLSLSGIATAQITPAPVVPSSPARAAATPGVNSSELFKYEVSVCYQFLRFDLSGVPFNLHGFNTSFTYFANDWFGFEGDVAPVFGDTPSNLRAKFLWYGGGPHIAYRYHPRFEPWAHALVGGAHFRFTQTIGSPTFNAFAYVVGGGVDIKLNPHFYWRVQSDFVGTNFADQWQKSVQVKSGIVFTF